MNGFAFASPRAHPHRRAVTWLRQRQLVVMAGLAALAFSLPVRAADDAAAVPGATAQQLGPNSYVLTEAEADTPLGRSAINAGFVVTATSVVMVGAPDSPAAAARWLDAVRAVTPKPVSHLLLTGFHPEQADAIAALKARGAAIVARRVTPPPAQTSPISPVAEEAAPTAAAEPVAVMPSATEPLAADLWLEDSTDLLFGGVHLQALALAPVHGPHEMAYVVADDAVLYAGELLVTGRLPDVRDADTARWIEVLAELQKQGATVVVPARGPVSREPQAELLRARDYLGLLRSAMGEAARSRTPFDEAYERGDWSPYAELPLFDTLNRANARHTYLQAQGAPE